MSLDKLTRECNCRCGCEVSSATIRKVLKQAGIGRTRPTRKPAEIQSGVPARVCWTERRHRNDGASGMNTDLTDASWALIAIDTLGLLSSVTITAASVRYRGVAALVVARACAKAPSSKALCAETACGSRCAETIEKARGIAVQIVRHPGNRIAGIWKT